jgi:hypothetical protein
METPTVKILCVHGVGQHKPGGVWEQEWKQAIAKGFASSGNECNAEIEFCYYDDLFAQYDISFADTFEAVGKLLKNGITSLFKNTRGNDGNLRWTAGMVVQWVENEKLRQQTRQRLFERINQTKPDVIMGHSLGSLVCYDTFTEPSTKGSIANRMFVSLGSQIGNAFVAGNFRAGRIEPLEQARHWYHLYNKEDDVFTAPLRLYNDRFTQIDTYFDEPGIADHSAPAYLAHKNTTNIVWQRLALEPSYPKLYHMPRAMAATEETAVVAKTRARLRAPNHRALIVGLNEYPDPSMQLEGCVNDSYLMSSVLQGAGFKPDNIRMVLDKRATRAGIEERLDWLLDGARAGDQRVFYYSGHGAQLPTYGDGDKVDRMDESLVPYDFDWSQDKAITDDQFYDLYSQLPYDTKFMAIFDCCHSGGLTRGSMARVRGVNPPDDIYHRSIRWREDLGLWLDRDVTAQKDVDETEVEKTPKVYRRTFGRAERLRTADREKFIRLRETLQHKGPYMPVLFYASRETEFAYEYRHGSVAHGAFTFSLAKNLRNYVARYRSAPSYNKLQQLVVKDLSHLGNPQHCVLSGPKAWLDKDVPFVGVKIAKAAGKRKAEPAEA